jgi:hypothetical protein
MNNFETKINRENLKKDHFKNALTKTKNPSKKYKIAPTFFAPKNTKTPPKNTKMAPRFFP